MTKGKCPQCGCKRFYFKDPENAFETYEFEVVDGQFRFTDDTQRFDARLDDEETMTFCDRCSWHDRLKTLK